jgi:hypothetical protein
MNFDRSNEIIKVVFDGYFFIIGIGGNLTISLVGKFQLKMIVAFCIIYFCLFSAFANEHAQEIHKRYSRVLLVIPGLGRPDRLSIVAHNLRIILPQQFQTLPGIPEFRFDCSIYIYASRERLPFWKDNPEDLKYLFEHCKIVELPGSQIASNLFMVQPHLLQGKYDYVFLILDDVKIPTASNFSLPNMIHLMHCNNLHLLSPRVSGKCIFLFSLTLFDVSFFFIFIFLSISQVLGATCCGHDIMENGIPRNILPMRCCRYRSVMQLLPEYYNLSSTTVAGYSSVFVELYAWVMTLQGYSLFWELLSPSLNSHGWGYDWWYYGYAYSRLNQSNFMGVTTDYTVVHLQGFEQTDKTSEDVKRDGLMKQEVYYFKHLHIPLRRFSGRFRNDSLVTAINGYLKRC